MENDDSYIVEYDPSSGEAMVYMHQDAPYDQERFLETRRKK